MSNKVLLTSEDYIKTYSNLNENVWGDYLLPAIRTAQDIGLQQILGSCLYNALLEMVDSGSITATTNQAYKVLLDDYIQDYLLFQVITDLVPVIGVKLANIGVVMSNDEHIENISETERNNIKQFYQYRADFYCRRLQEFILGNKEAFAELEECQCSKIKANLDSAASTGLWLGGIRSKLIIENNCCSNDTIYFN